MRPAGDKERTTVLRALGVVAVPDGLDGFVHNGSVHVIGSSGQVYGIFDYEQWRDALLLA